MDRQNGQFIDLKIKLEKILFNYRVLMITKLKRTYWFVHIIANFSAIKN